MRLLLDTHALLWWAHEPEHLSPLALEAIGDPDNDMFVSAVSAMEIATKGRRGRLEYNSPLVDQFLPTIEEFGFLQLPVRCAHAQLGGSFMSANNDPWDRLLAAQAKLDNLALISNDSKMDEFGISQFW